MRVFRVLLDAVRGALIGAAEVIPGVSGGTIALVVGVYDELIGSAGHLVRGIVSAVRRQRDRARGHFSQVNWWVVVPVLIGMAVAVVVAARILAPLVEDYPVQTRAVFFGLILASIVVPIRMVGYWRIRDVIFAVGSAVVAFFLTGLPPAGNIDPPLIVVPLAAAVAICALVLPGVSGSFILLVVGMYAPTLAAVNDRNVGYLALFALGAIVGLALFVPALQWLLEHRRSVTLAIMTGLMVGSLRALWPWLGSDRELLPPGSDWLVVMLLILVGIGVVAVLLIAEYRSRLAQTDGPVANAVRRNG